MLSPEPASRESVLESMVGFSETREIGETKKNRTCSFS